MTRHDPPRKNPVTEFEKLLGDVAQGKSTLAPLRTWLDAHLQTPDCNLERLLSAVEQAQKSGLSQPVALVLRKQIEAVRQDAKPSDRFELSSLIPGKDRHGRKIKSKATGVPPGFVPVHANMEPTHTGITDADRTLVTAPPTDLRETATDRPPTVPQSGDRTVVTAPPSGGTSGHHADTDHTEVMTDQSGEDRTITATRADAEDTYDPFAPETTSVSGAEPSSTGWSTSSSLKATGGSHKVGPGSILKGRFELVNVLGEGGMGKVYRARDLLKVEAKDKNPFIAVKTLSGDFKEHPEAFIALQREASKAQRLAHPNIATVFDFDRDGSTVYLTMELMEGEELSSYIKRLPAGGLPVPEAMNIIRQLCDGLAYAHSKGLVHSDFKPGNGFLTTDGTVKLLDFGIARASKTRKDASGETTMFDPSELGALTPAYASLEMFEGDDPDPRDDIYALACVSYELLTGKHPFNKLSAPKVLEKGLRPVAVAKLSKRQNRALLHALAIQRDERTATVEQFWEGIRPKKSAAMTYVPIAAAALIIIVLLGYKPMVDYLQTRRNNTLITKIEAGNTDIPSVLTLIGTFSPDSRRYVLDNAKDRIIAYFETQAEAFVDESRGQYNYAAALEEITRAESYYSDSAELLQERSSLATRRANLLVELTNEFNELLAAGKIVPGNGKDITNVITILKVADPGNTLLHDERLTSRYAGLVQAGIKSGNYGSANQILLAGLAYAPQDPELLNLEDQVQREFKQQRDAQQITQLEDKLKQAAPQLHTLTDFQGVHDDMLNLRQLNPGDAVLGQLDSALKNALQAAISTAAGEKNWSQAEQILFAYARLLNLQDLLAQRQALSQAEVQANYVPADLQARLQRIQQHRAGIADLLDKPKYSSDWDNQLMGNTQETAVLLLPNDQGWFKDLREQIATAYIKLAQQMQQQNRFDAAATLINTGEQYAPQLPTYAAARQSLSQAQQAFEQVQTQQLREAQNTALENQFQTQLNAGQINAARQTYASLQRQLPARDAFFIDTAPKAYATAYLNLAKERAATGDYHGAITLVKGGQQYAPLDSLKQALRDYTAQADRVDLFAMVDTLQPADISSLKTKLAGVQQQLPQQRGQLADNLLRKLVQHINDLKFTDPGLANQLLSTAKSAFPGSPLIQGASLPPPPQASKFAKLGRDAVAQNNLSKAQAYLEQGQQQETGNPELVQFSQQLQTAEDNANRYFAAYQEYMRAGQANQAKAYLAEAMRLWADNPDYLAEYQRNFAASPAPTISINGGRPCSVDLAGYGSQGRAECYDLVGNGVRGPTMVVVPAGGEFRQPFAIGKYEVSTAQFNTYCRATSQCKLLPGDGGLPAANLPFSAAQSYVAWLTARSGAHYYIPSYAEYRYAGSVGGTDASRDFNCQVILNGQQIKGLTIVSIGTGRPNAWGLVNYVGNVQEWVLGAGGVEAVGGDYQDSLSQCSVDLVRASNGAADPLTGFRVARDIDK